MVNLQIPGNPTDIGLDPSLGVFAGLLAAFFFVFIIVAIALYIYFAIALMTIAKKTNTNNAWLAWIPIGNLFLMANIAKVHWAFALGAIISFIIPVVGVFLGMGILIYMWWKIAEVRGFPSWTSLLLLIPVVNLVLIGVYAWGK